MTANHGSPGRDPWDLVVIPQCPCPWRTVCSTWVQEGVGQLWRSGRLTKPEDCFYFAHRADVHRTTTGHEAPATSEEMLAQLAERKAVSEGV